MRSSYLGHFVRAERRPLRTRLSLAVAKLGERVRRVRAHRIVRTDGDGVLSGGPGLQRTATAAATATLPGLPVSPGRLARVAAPLMLRAREGGAAIARTARTEVWPALRDGVGPSVIALRQHVGNFTLWQLVQVESRPSWRRRLRFAVVVVISQMLLIALALAWLIHMILIAVKGAVFFVEQNSVILWTEIIATVLIVAFAGWVFAVQLRRLSERRRGDDRPEGGRRDDDRRR